MENLETLHGSVESIVFRNRVNGYTVFEIDCGKTLETIVGIFPDLAEGEVLTIRGEWSEHPSYGRQFKATDFEQEMPATAEAMLRYLSSGTIKGIGPVIAKRIIDVFGESTLEILENNPKRLAEVKGISPKKASELSEAYKNQFGVRTCMLFLQQYGLNSAQSLRVWKCFGSSAIEQIKENPYLLCESGLWIGFDLADKIAKNMGIKSDDAFRIRAGITHILRHNLYSGGHTYIPFDKLTALSKNLLKVSTDEVEIQIDSMTETEDLVAEEFNDRRVLFLPEPYRAETYIAGRLLLMGDIHRQDTQKINHLIKETETKLGITYAEKQCEAIRLACQSHAMILTGGPGTGKTTTLNAMIHIFETMGLKIALAAPTGRAAKRMTEISGHEAKTIHRLLEISFGDEDNARFARNEKNPLDCDVLIVDELSMMDVLLFESLLRALKMGCRLIMMGDADQLPPVGPGNALRDIIASRTIPSVVLDEIFRQAGQSLIITNAHRIVHGEMPILSHRDGDFFFLPRQTAAQTAATVIDLVHSRLPAAYGHSPFEDIQILTPGRKGELGSIAFNKGLQSVLNPANRTKAECPSPLGVLREGDKVMQIKNNYDLVWKRDNGKQGTGIFNGDVGVIAQIDRRTNSTIVHFEGRTVEYGPELLDELELAYAVTVHKSQGSEFPVVILPLFSGAPMLFYRNLLYTAVTRSKKLTILVGRQKTIEYMVQNNQRAKRYTGLRIFLQNGDIL